MSVRAYKIIKIITEKSPSFNCWYDDRIFGIANTEYYGSDGGFIELEKSSVEDLLEEVKEELREHNEATPDATKQETVNLINTLEGILKDFEEGEDYVRYECY